MTAEGWRFGDYPGADRDEVNGKTYHARDLHRRRSRISPAARPCRRFGTASARTIVNNESADILRMFNSGFGALARRRHRPLSRGASRAEIDALNDAVYPKLNNGVYRAGFATTQEAYEEAFHDVFAMLDELERRVGRGPYLFGETLTETDIRVFVTLARFDAAYHGLFKCNLRRIADYPALSGFVRAMFALPAVRETFSLDHIKRGYYSIKSLNPSGIMPIGPELPGFPD